MAYNVIITAEAYLDINEATEWYDQQVKDLGIDFVLEFYEEANTLSINPELFVVVIKPIRKRLMQRFPYTIYYSILEQRKEVLIEAVWHQKRNLSQLKKRFKK